MTACVTPSASFCFCRSDLSGQSLTMTCGMVSPCLDAQHGLDGAALIHCAIALRNVGKRNHQIKNLARIDLSFRHQFHQVRKEPAHGSRGRP